MGVTTVPAKKSSSVHRVSTEGPKVPRESTTFYMVSVMTKHKPGMKSKASQFSPSHSECELEFSELYGTIEAANAAHDKMVAAARARIDATPRKPIRPIHLETDVCGTSKWTRMSYAWYFTDDLPLKPSDKLDIFSTTWITQCVRHSKRGKLLQ